MKEVLLSTTYFGPIQWYQKLYRAECVQIEQWESFQKQTYRNRCLIATTQGVQALTVPIERLSTVNYIKDIRISDHGNWRHLHWNALQSAYGESPFFEYYQDDIRPFYEKRWDYLLDFNEAIRVKMCELIDIQPRVNYSKSWSVECGVWSEDTQRVDSAVASASESNLTPHSTLHTPHSTLHTPHSTKCRLSLRYPPQESRGRPRLRIKALLPGMAAKERVLGELVYSRPAL